MDLTYPAEAEAFRAQVRTWLEANLPDGWFDDDFELSPEERGKFSQEWTGKLYEAGWICAAWPTEYGGRGLSTIENVVLHEEFTRAKAPMRSDWFGDTLVGPTILRWGSEEQKQFFIPKILKGEITFCQGFSEPDAGSDLAGLRTRAELRDGEWVINGQKIWTTRADEAGYIFLLARTDPEAPRQAGISYLLVPMDQPGVEIRPIEQLDGAADFYEVFFTDARAPEDWAIGGVNQGWKVAMTTLGFERGASLTTSHRRFEKEFQRLVAGAQSNGASRDPIIRQRLAEQWSKIQITRINGLRMLSDTLHGTDQAAALGPLTRLWWTEMHQETLDLGMDILGAAGQVLTGSASGEQEWVPGVGSRRGRPSYPASPDQRAFLFSLSDTIGGGTSEIQRNILAERILRLPKEPKGS